MSDLLAVAIVGAIQAITTAWLNRKMTSTNTKVDSVSDKVDAVHEVDQENRKILAEKVDAHNELVSQKLEENTRLTVEASGNASQAYQEANHFNQRLARIESDLKAKVEGELVRLSSNIHKIANALQPIVGSIHLERRPEDPEPRKKP